jgi:hypothetical protein
MTTEPARVTVSGNRVLREGGGNRKMASFIVCKAVEFQRVVNRRGSHILPPGRFLLLSSVRGSFDPRAPVRMEGLGKLENPMT